jgi:predicted lipoprotein with Yx(FWY)xxD motif
MRRILGLGLVAVLVLAACGKSSNGSAPGGSPSQGSSAGTATLGVNAMKVPGVGTVLVDSRGFTLYHLQGETTSNLKCTGSCLSTWPPLLDNSGVKPTGGAGVTGTLSTFSALGGGTQVAYNGMPLYTFTGDSASGQANGQGVAGFSAVAP